MHPPHCASVAPALLLQRLERAPRPYRMETQYAAAPSTPLLAVLRVVTVASRFRARPVSGRRLQPRTG